ncbi:aquaporin-11 [Gastrophryne carolinensis]
MGAMELVLNSAALVGCVLLLCEFLRWVLQRTLRPGLVLELAMELVSTLQLCCVTQEMVILGTRAHLHLWHALTLTYVTTVLHCMTFRTAGCNPCGSVGQWLRGQVGAPHTLLRVMAQFAGAALSQVLMPHLWSLGLSPLHHLELQDCKSPLNVSLLSGALVEMSCTLSLFLILHHLPRVSEPLRPHAVALTITGIVYAGAPLTGAVFNPALAFAVFFPCIGNTYQQFMFVYWIGPLIGTVLSVLLLESMFPKHKLGNVSGRDDLSFLTVNSGTSTVTETECLSENT